MRYSIDHLINFTENRNTRKFFKFLHCDQAKAISWTNHLHFYSQEIRINGEPFNKPISLQLAASNGKYSNVARLALSQPSLTIQTPLKNTEKYGSHSRIYDNNCPQSHHRSRHCSRRGSGVMLRKDILYAGSLFNIPEYK